MNLPPSCDAEAVLWWAMMVMVVTHSMVALPQAKRLKYEAAQRPNLYNSCVFVGQVTHKATAWINIASAGHKTMGVSGSQAGGAENLSSPRMCAGEERVLCGDLAGRAWQVQVRESGAKLLPPDGDCHRLIDHPVPFPHPSNL